MDRNELHQIIKSSACGSKLLSTDIPSIDLYIDQIITLVNGKMGEDAQKNGERLLTKTMINNYSKDDIIKPIKGKKYTKEHIIQMLLVYSLKGTVSISEIKRLIHGIYEQKGFDGERLTACYDRFVGVRNNVHEKISDWIDDFLEGYSLDVENEDDFLVALMSFISLSSQFRYLAEKLIESHYEDYEEIKKEKPVKKDKDKKEVKNEKN